MRSPFNYWVSKSRHHYGPTFNNAGVSSLKVGRGSGHSSYVGAIALSDARIFSGSKDGVLKMWKRPEVSKDDTEIRELSTIRTVLAHNQVDVLVLLMFLAEGSLRRALGCMTLTSDASVAHSYPSGCGQLNLGFFSGGKQKNIGG